jgi:hypothetical protein
MSLPIRGSGLGAGGPRKNELLRLNFEFGDDWDVV